MSVLVWFKRDLRIHDHEALNGAIKQARLLNAPVVALFAFEPAWLNSPDVSTRHIRFFYHAALALREELRDIGIPLRIHLGSLKAVFEALHQQSPISHVFCHEETGLMWSYQRDIAVQRWCSKYRVVYVETPQNGVVRRLKSRDGWAVKWLSRMRAPMVESPAKLVENMSTVKRNALDDWVNVPAPAWSDLAACISSSCDLAVEGPEANRLAAELCLKSFLNERMLGYSNNISSPNQAWNGCSRISHYLSSGILSVREVFQATQAVDKRWKMQTSADDPALKSLALRSLRSFGARLRWHCHFMQKLEDDPHLDTQALWSGSESLRQEDSRVWSEEEAKRFHAWQHGQTGFPMIDACMRCLIGTGWINFRMRSMLASFASYQLWLHWRETGLHLARLFIDYEPGIHWAQMQMQSGSTAINTLRMYSPTKQAKEQDPEGVFIRRWVPELQNVPLVYLAQPWLMGAETQQLCGCVIGQDYPTPIVDEHAALQHAKDVLYGLRKQPGFKLTAEQIARQHGSRKSNRRRSTSK